MENLFMKHHILGKNFVYFGYYLAYKLSYRLDIPRKSKFENGAEIYSYERTVWKQKLENQIHERKYSQPVSGITVHRGFYFQLMVKEFNY